YKDPGTPATISQDGDKIEVLFKEGVSAIAPGQAAVFYDGDDVIGGGWIMKSFRQGDQQAHQPFALSTVA
ncbi:MAG: tRNA 2-thiouridine(34) synthase MnmA, partial [Cytophagaceae bacterium]